VAKTQVEIAREAGLDVSSVNKILNGHPVAKFRPETVKRVRQLARLGGWVRKCRTCGESLRKIGNGITFKSGRVICVACSLFVLVELSKLRLSGAPPILPPPCGPLPEPPPVLPIYVGRLKPVKGGR